MELKRRPSIDLDSQGYDILTARFDVEGDLQRQILFLRKKVDALHKRGIPIDQDTLQIITLLRKKSINSMSANLLTEAMENGLL